MTATRPAPTPMPATGPAAVDGFGPPPSVRPARSIAGALLGVLLIVFCAAGVAVYTSRVGHRHPVLVVTRPIKAGAVIGPADVGEARLSADRGVRTVAANRRDQIIGRVAGVNLVAGTLLTNDDLATGPEADADHAIVGLALKAGQYPAVLRPLDPVMVVDAGIGTAVQSGPAGASPNVLATSARVTAVDQAPDGQTTVISVLVSRQVAPAVAAASAHGAVSLILVGGPAPG